METAVNGGDVEKKVNGAAKRKRTPDEGGMPLPIKRRLVDVDSTDSDSQDSIPSVMQPDTSDCNNLSDVSRAESNSQLVRSESQSCAENNFRTFDKCYDSHDGILLDSSTAPADGNATSSDSRSFDKCFNHSEAEADGRMTSNDDSKDSFVGSLEGSKVAASPREITEGPGNTSNPSADKRMFDKCFDSSKVTHYDLRAESQSSNKCSDSSENESIDHRLVGHSAPSESQSSDKCLNISDTQIDKTSNSSQSFAKSLESSEAFSRDLTEDHLSSDQDVSFERKDEEPEELTSSIHGQSGLTFSECLKRSEYNTSNQISDSLAKCTSYDTNKKVDGTLQSNTDRSDAHLEFSLNPSVNSFKTSIEATLIPIGNSSKAKIESFPLHSVKNLETTTKSEKIPITESSSDKTQLTLDPSAASTDTIEGYPSSIADSFQAKTECSLQPNIFSNEESKEKLYPDVDTSQSLAPKRANSCDEKVADIFDPSVGSPLSCSNSSSYDMCLDSSEAKSNVQALSNNSTALGQCLLSEEQTMAESSCERGEDLKPLTPETKGLSPESGVLLQEVDTTKSSAEELAARGEELLELGSGSLEAAELRAAARRGLTEVEGRDGQEEYAQYLGLTPTVKFRCSRCSVATFETLQRLQSHQSRGGCSRSAGAAAAAGGTNFRITRKVYLCSACGTYYEHSELFLHMHQEHARHICLFCLSMYISAEKLSAHLCARHEADADAAWAPHACFLECVGCERVFSETDDFACHGCQSDRPLSAASCKIEAVAAQPSESGDDFAHVADLQPVEDVAMQSPECTSPRLAEDIADKLPEETPVSQPSESQEPQPSASRLQMALEAKLPEDISMDRRKSLESSINNLVPSAITSPVLGEKSSAPTFSSPVQSMTSPAVSIRSPEASIPESPIPSAECVSEPRFPGAVEPSIADVLGIQADEAVIMPLPPAPEPAVSDISAGPSALPDSAKASKRRTKRPRRRAAPRKRKPPPKPREPEPEVVALAGREAPLLPLPAVSSEPASELLRACVLAAAAGCVYCNHARLIAVCARQLLLHLLAEHRFLPADMPEVVPANKPRLDSRSEDMDVDVCLSPVKVKEEEKLEDLSAEADNDATLALKEARATEVTTWLRAALPGAEGWHINADTFDSRDEAAGKTWDGSYECFHCHLQVRQHKELYLHNRKLHQKTCLLCVMCKRNFYSYSELLCHRCPGLYVPGALPAGFRCPLCCRGDLPSAFRLMVHMRREHHACDVCLVTTGDQPRLQAHVWKHKLAHVCLRCGIAYRNKPDITKHLFWKHGTESAACRRCLQKKWPHVYHFCQPPQHFVCEDCPRRFSRAVALRVHRRVHSSAPLPYACTECEERVVSRRLLARHKAKHEVPPPPPPEPELPPEPPAAPTPPPPAASPPPPPVEQSRKKSRKSKQRAPVVDVYDLPPLNLSSDSDSEAEPEAAAGGDGVAQTAGTAEGTDAVAGGSGAPESAQKKKPSEDRADDGELPVPDAVPSVWDDFRQYKARLEAERERTPAEQLEAVMADHDYCVGAPGTQPAPTAADTDHDYCSPTKGAMTAPVPAGPATPPPPPVLEPPAPPKPAPSSSSSSSSSSSCSCGPDCSCSSSSSTDSSSDSSTREGRQRQEGRRRGRKLKILPVLPPSEEPPPVVEEPPPPEPDEEAERESDLDTSEPETDEEFYDTHPALATGLPRGAATPAAPPGALGSPARHDKKRKHRRHAKLDVGAPQPALPPGGKRRPKPKRFFGDSDEEEAATELLPGAVVAPPPTPPPPVARVPPIVIMAAPLAVTPPSSDSEDEPALVIASPSPPPMPAPAPAPATGTASSGGTGSNLFCYCQCPYDEVSEMIACDGAACHIEWFHFECVGIMVPPQGKWFCPDCRRDNDQR